MKKGLLAFICIFLLLILTACHQNAAEKTNKDTKREKININNELNQEKKTDKFQIKLTSAKLIENPWNPDNRRLTLELGVYAKNKSKSKQTIGTGDFQIYDKKGKKYTFTGSENNFGGEVKPAKTIKGKGYYSVPINMREAVVIYKPFRSTGQQKWEIKVTPLKSNE